MAKADFVLLYTLEFSDEVGRQHYRLGYLSNIEAPDTPEALAFAWQRRIASSVYKEFPIKEKTGIPVVIRVEAAWYGNPKLKGLVTSGRLTKEIQEAIDKVKGKANANS